MRHDFGTDYTCYADLETNETRVVSIEEMKNTKCESFGNLNKANELWENQDKYNWKEFSTDKRTAHYKSVKRFIENGADMYLTIYQRNEYKYFDNNPIYEFWHEKALVHYKDGSFIAHRFRSIRNGKCGSDI